MMDNRSIFKILIFIAASGIVYSSNNSSLAFDVIKEYQNKKWDVDINSNYFRTDGNYLSGGGSIRSLANAGYLQTLDTDFSTRFVLFDNWGFYANTTLGYAESNNGYSKRSNSNLKKASGGIDYLWYNDGFDFISDLQFTIPLEKISNTQNTVINNEGVMETKLLFRLQKDYDGFFLHGSMGYINRSEGRSALLPWGIGCGFSFDSGKMYGAELVNYSSISDDVDAGNTSARYLLLDQVNAGSYKYYSVNPRYSEMHLYYITDLTQKLLIEMDGNFSVTGANSASGYGIGIGLRYSFDLNPTKKKSGYLDPSSQRDQEKLLKNFKEENNDETDQKLFEQEKIKLKPSTSDEDVKVKLKRK